MNRTYFIIVTILVVVGSILPWAQIFGLYLWGMETDGILTFFLGVIGATFAAVNLPKTSLWIPKIVHGILALLVILIAGYHVGSFAAIGVYVTLLAGVAWLVGAFLPFRRENVVSTSTRHPDADRYF